MWTKKTYKQYQDAVDRNLEGLHAVSTGACSGCVDCDLSEDPTMEDLEIAEEPHFSWSACECCGSLLGGDRHPAHGLTEDNEIIHFSVCVDCLHFLNYGQLDDMSMMDIDESEE